jgi:hypothetical protein
MDVLTHDAHVLDVRLRRHSLSQASGDERAGNQCERAMTEVAR